MKNFAIKSFVFLLIIGILFSCNKNDQQDNWIVDQNGVKLWVDEDNKELQYIWEGETFDSVAHGAGVLKIIRNDSVIEERNIEAYYGSINPKSIVSVGANEKYIGNLSGDKFNGYGVYVKGNEIYVGNFKESKPEGFLSLYKNGNFYYTGYWSEGKFNGEGTLYKEDGSIKSGDWEHGNLVQTEVDVQLPEGHYKGYVKNNLPDGIGTMVYQDRSKYSGKWKNGLWDGEGTYISAQDTIIANWESGNIIGDAILSIGNYFYEGSIFDNSPNGIGNLIVENGSFYSGGWLDGKRSGIGEIYFVNGDSYIGEWKNNEFNGEGTYQYLSQKSKYRGTWKDGLQDGIGSYESPEFSYIGEWEAGWIDGEGIFKYKNGDSYNGTFHENLFDGIGTYTFSNGNFYEGEFIKGKISGLGRFHFKNGSLYEGEFLDGKIYGDGTLHLIENGKSVSITGFWTPDGKFPTKASILFPSGDIFEGSIVNGFPSKDGIWISSDDVKKRKLVVWLIENSPAHIANEFYKRNKETINWVLTGASVAVTTVGIFAGPEMAVIAESINIAINAIDATLAIESAKIDIAENLILGEDISEPLEELGTQVALNAAFILLPKAFKALKPLGKPIKNVVRSNLGLLAEKSTGSLLKKKSVINFTKGKIFGKQYKINLEKVSGNKKKLNNVFNRTAPIEVQAKRLLTPNKAQYITYKRFQNNSVKNLNLTTNGNSANLKSNMLAVLGEPGEKMIEGSKKLANKYRGTRNQVEAHHILTAFPNEARLNPDQARTLKEAQDFFKQTFGSLDHPINGIFVGRGAGKEYVGLAKGASHGMHSVEYNMEVARRILVVKKLVKDKYKNDPDMARLLLGEEMDALKRGIRSGNILIQTKEKSFIYTWFGFKKPKI